MDKSVHGICDSFVDDYVALDPVTATELGIPGYDDQLPDLSPAGTAAHAELVAGGLRAVVAAEPADTDAELAKAVFTERMGLERELHDAGLRTAELNVLASPPQGLRQVFDLMPTDTAAAWATIATRLARMPAALAGYRESLLALCADVAAGRPGRIPAVRQVRKVAEQCDTWSGRGGSESFFATFARAADQVPGVAGAIRSDLDAGVCAAAEAYADLATFLRERLLPSAVERDAVGEEIYQLWSRQYIGARLDLRDAYEWGWAEFSRIEAEMKRVAERIKPGAGLAEAAAALDEDPRYLVRGRTEFRDWMQSLSDQAITDLRDVHFEIPDQLARLDCRIAPPGGGVGAYYTNPTEDFSRPGAMWWSLPPDKEEFSTWREVSIVYHEGVPGHHLQIGTATYQGQRLNRFQRMLAWVPAYGEGWALYAERLMREFGYLGDDGNLFGMLNENLLRAARVIVDIGMHLELEIPAGTGFHEGERWTPQLGLEFMLTRTITEPALVRDEIDRYLGWPGQAPAYKLGERLWLSAREQARARHGAAFDLKRFHTEALSLGPMGLDTLRDTLAAL